MAINTLLPRVTNPIVGVRGPECASNDLHICGPVMGHPFQRLFAPPK
jgi:hypothetical protein